MSPSVQKKKKDTDAPMSHSSHRVIFFLLALKIELAQSSVILFISSQVKAVIVQHGSR